MNLKIKGDFSTDTAFEWKTKLQELCQQNTALRLDLTELTHTDIVGVNALSKAYKLSCELGHTFEIVLKPSGELYRMLHLTKFLDIIPNELIA